MRKLALLLLAGTIACGSSGGDNSGPAHWVATWATGPQLTETSNNPPASLTNATLRQVVHASIGGSRIRLKLSNAYGDGPVEVRAVRVALPMGGTPSGAIDPNTNAVVTFGGSGAVTIPAGETRTSDELRFEVPPLGNVAVSIAFGATPAGITGHPGSRTTSYIVSGDETASGILVSPSTTEHWYYIQAVDVDAPQNARAVAILGDSITDGRGSTTNGNDRWADDLSERLQAASDDVAVANLGIGGNAILTGGLGPTAKVRFDADILGQSGVAWVMVFEGVNDIGAGAQAPDLIAAYQEFIDKAHAQGLRIYGATITPFAGSQYGGTAQETVRQTVNTWILTSGNFDAVVDLAAAVQSPAAHDTLLPAYDSGDHLHLSPAGYQVMAQAVDLGIFQYPYP
jgi:lysophospholipase L1-like esterase